MIGFLVLGFLIGMAHALEADHLTAMATLASDRKMRRRRLVMRGTAWGIGHTLALFAVCATAVTFGIGPGETFQARLEFAIGTMLTVLGIHVLWTMRRRRIHFHAHSHDGGPVHIHAHSHQGAQCSHTDDPHEHGHARSGSMRALMIGLLHGSAGSASLLALATAGAHGSGMLALGYVLVFGFGSVIGMGILSLVASWPLAVAERSARVLHGLFAGLSGMVAMTFGVYVMSQTSTAAWGSLWQKATGG